SKAQVAWHSGSHKLYSGDSGETWELYNLETDPAEAIDLATTHPELTAQLRSEVARWQASCKRSGGGADY
ncbi:MAG: hypothetical protein P8J37_21490, partial [Fuerstiella sp.]|nr:hypothetical protein [Fuerstiella sp.]